MVKRTIPAKVEADRMIQAGEHLALPEPEQKELVDLSQKISSLEQTLSVEEES